MPWVTPTAGDLRDKIALRARTQAPGAGGKLTDTWTTIATVWARVLPIFGGRYIAGAQVEERATHVATIRFRSDFSTWRYFEHRGRRYLIRSVSDPDMHRKWLELLAEELANA